MQRSGGSAAGASTLEFKVADEPNPPTFSIPALDPSRCESVERTRQLSEGSYQNRVVADVNDAVSESDETNNETTITYEVGPPAVPDLAVASIDNTPQNPTIKDEITFEVEVCNEGIGRSRKFAGRVQNWGGGKLAKALPSLNSCRSVQRRRAH